MPMPARPFGPRRAATAFGPRRPGLGSTRATPPEPDGDRGGPPQKARGAAGGSGGRGRRRVGTPTRARAPPKRHVEPTMSRPSTTRATARRVGPDTPPPVRGRGGATGTASRRTVAWAWAVAELPSLSTAVAVTVSVWVAGAALVKSPGNEQV